MNKPSSRSFTPVYIFAVILLLGLHYWQIKNTDNARELLAVKPYSDAYLYHYSAWFKASVSEGSFVSKILAFSPYEILLSYSIKLFGHSNVAPFILNSLLSVISCILLISCTKRMFSEQAAIICAALYLFCDPILFFNGTTLKTNLVICLTTISLWCSISFFSTYKKRWVILLSISMFMCAIERVHVLVFPIAFLIILWTNVTRLNVVKKIRYSAICLSCLFIMYAISSLSYPIGLNIYLGHTKPDNWNLWVDGVRNNLIGHREDAKKLAEKDMGKSLSNSEVTEFWLLKTIDYIKSNPGLYLKSQTQKLGFIFSPTTYQSQESYHHWRKKEAPLSFAFINFATIFPLFIIGLVLLKKKKMTSKASNLTVLASVLYLASLMATIVIERYRVTAFVFMIPIALIKKDRKIVFVIIFLVIFTALHFVGQLSKNNINQAKYTQLELKDAQERMDQKTWFDLRARLDREPLSAEICYQMQKELINIRYNRELKTLALACAKY